ncbi:hypothetical protein GCM10009804_53140 [Kribbella hippodromi]|uniref:DUF2975 domain-containing protein n=1 Tax=Kribbella hippodromi TaxID=434347 RepID=A0ABN2DZH9_9ACTN
MKLGWSRTDSNALTGLLGLAFAIEGLLGVLIPALHIAGLIGARATREVGVTDLAQPLAASGGLTGSGGMTGGGVMTLSAAESATLTVADPSLGQRVLLDLPALFNAVPILLGLYLLFLVARTLSTGDPFEPRNPRRIFGISILIVIGSLGDGLLTALTNHFLVVGTPLEEHVPFSWHISFLPLGVAAVVAALAQAFRVGVRLREDTEGLV